MIGRCPRSRNSRSSGARLGRAAALLLLFATLVAPLFVAPSTAQAVVLVSNHGEGITSFLNVGNTRNSQGFTTGSTAAGYTLDAAVIIVGPDLDQAIANGLTVNLHPPQDADSSVPHVTRILATLTHPPNLTAGRGAKEFTTASRIVLSPNTNYFILITSTGGALSLGITRSTGESAAADGWSLLDDLPAQRLTIKGTPINTPPTSSDNTVTALEDTAYTFQTSDFDFNDNDTGDTLAGVKVVTPPALGSLTLDGTTVTADQVVTKAELDDGKLKYTPAANDYGAAYTSLAFKVNDGTDDSASTYTMTIDVTRVNNLATGAPTISGTAEFEEMLTVLTSGIADTDGKAKAEAGDAGYAYTYQWYRVEGNTETPISSATATTYTVGLADNGKKINVRVSFTDDLDNPEEISSADTATVTGGPSLSIGDASAVEGNAVSFTVTLSPAAAVEATVDYAVSTSGVGNTASSGDLTGTMSGTLTFAAGDGTKTLTVDTSADDRDELDETFTVTLSNATNNVLIADTTATGTVTDDDDTPKVTLTLADLSILESDDTNTPGNQHQTTVRATLSGASSVVTTVTVTPVAGVLTVSGTGGADHRGGAGGSRRLGDDHGGGQRRRRRAEQACSGDRDGGEHHRHHGPGRSTDQHPRRRPYPGGDAGALSDFDPRVGRHQYVGRPACQHGDGDAERDVDGGDDGDGVGGGGEPGGVRRLQSQREQNADLRGRSDRQHRDGDDHRGGQQHRRGEQDGDGLRHGGEHRRQRGSGRRDAHHPRRR